MQVYPGNTYSHRLEIYAFDRALGQYMLMLMAFRYDYSPYNDTIAAEVYDNLYVRIFGVHSFIGPHLES